jgi:phage terminase large subunit
MKLTIKQTKALDALEDKQTRELIFGGGAGGGKSALGCYWQIKNRLKYAGSRGLIGRSVLKTLKETTLQTFFEIASKQELKAGTHFTFNQQSNQVTFFNGSTILFKDLFLYPSDPNFDELGSLEITDAFVDEVNQVTYKAWSITGSRIRYKLTDFNLIPKKLGTCNPAKNWVYEKYYKPDRDGVLPSNLRFIQSLVTDNPNISKHYLENLQVLDEIDRERLLHGNWEYDNDPARLMEFNAINDIFTNDYVARDNKYISADIARFGKDNTVIGIWDGLRCERIEILSKSSIVDTSKRIKEIMNQNSIQTSRVIVDEDGVGGGVRDTLGCIGFVNNSSPVDVQGKKQNFNNLKSQCYFYLAEKINKGELYVNENRTEVRQSLIQELEQVKRNKIDSDGKLSVIPKEEVKKNIGRSPDFSDMIMMRMYFEIKPILQPQITLHRRR